MAKEVGYSGKPLSEKLGLKPGMRILVRDAPNNYRELLGTIPDNVEFAERISQSLQMVHLFCTERKSLARQLSTLREKLESDAIVWISWPKKSAKVETDITEDTIREVCLPMGFVDVKVCAVSEVWSGLKLVVRTKLR